jgi:type I restriction enzyme M protein
MATNFRGYDISPDMVRLSLVNLYLHDFQSPQIAEYDTLTSEDKWNEFADVILANPPFMSPKGGIKPHKRFSIQAKRSEVLFLDYIIEHLNPNGRAGIIVPEGVHFVSQGSYIQLRRTLLEQGFLIADITLPHGVFKPYASVKTHILIVDRSIGQQNDSILFIEIENDGFSQSDTRDPVIGSQLNTAMKHFVSFKKSIQDKQQWVRPDNDLRSYVISKSVLLDSRNAHLLGRWYDLPNRVIHRGDIPLMSIGDLCDICDGLSPNMATQAGDYVMVVPAEYRKTADHWDFNGKAVCIPLVSSAGHGKAAIKRIHYQEGEFALANTMCALFVKDESIIHPRYLYIFLSAMRQELLVPLMCGATNVTMSSDQLANVIIPVPKISVQEEVVESDLIYTKAALITSSAVDLRDLSSDNNVVQFAERVISDIETFLKAAKNRIDISEFLPF